MCGIIGYTGKDQALQIVMRGLAALEYRGYDSCGLSAFSSDGNEITVIKKAGRLKVLSEALSTVQLNTRCAIGHTRWATHGAVTEENAHPHRVGKTVIVHNGIIENYKQIESELQCSFQGSTDTERACALIDRYYEQTHDGKQAIINACSQIEGSYAFLIMFEDEKNTIYATSRACPLIVGHGENGSCAISDISACRLDTYCRLNDGESARLTPDGISVYASDGHELKGRLLPTDVKTELPSKNGYPHFMLKEINEIPTVLRKTIDANTKDGLPFFKSIPDSVLKDMKRLTVIGCGTAYHAGLCAVHTARELSGIDGAAYIASEYRYSRPTVKKGDVVVFISQSGETADTLACIRMCRSLGAYTLGIINVPYSTASFECDGVIYTHAGFEIAVASTKAYVCQLAALYLLIFKASLLQNALSEKKVREYTKILKNDVPENAYIDEEKRKTVYNIAKKHKDSENMFYIGRGIDSILCSEASLKLKEVSYIHSEAYPAGELKHGAISLITPDVSVFVIATDKKLIAKTENNMQEVSSRGGRLILLGDSEMKGCDIIPCNSLQGIFSPFAASPLFQLYAYYTALLRGCDPDMPRNLAKSVTVE